ncbi:MAG TPA: hypothetical protein VN636_06125 [Acidimicrobiia bacterium]|nr:hypothetical protein [Acidimicrobiia bacterium]
MALTPAIREFMVRLEHLLDVKAPPGLDRASVAVTTANAVALVRLPHVSDRRRDVEVEITDRHVVVRYAPEHISFTSRDEALRFVEMLCDGRVEIEVSHHLLWTTMRSYRDGQALPFRRTRMPWPTLRPRTERRPAGFG